jgi:hypothetical protein
VQALPGARLVQGEAFPVRWTERGWVDREEHLLHVAGGMECLLSARWSTAEPPPAAAEFFARARLR